MKNRFVQFSLSAWLLAISGHSVWSQSSLYFDRVNFLGACQTIPGLQQGIDFADVRLLIHGPTVTISNVTFTGRSLGAKGIDSGIALYNFDSHIPLSIHFANGARAFGAEFSSQYNAVPSFTATLSLDNGETFQFTAPTDPNSTFLDSYRQHPSWTSRSVTVDYSPRRASGTRN